MKWGDILKGDTRRKRRFLLFPKVLPCRYTVTERLEWRWLWWYTWEQEVKAVNARRGDYKVLEWRDTCWIDRI